MLSVVETVLGVVTLVVLEVPLAVTAETLVVKVVGVAEVVEGVARLLFFVVGETLVVFAADAGIAVVRVVRLEYQPKKGRKIE